jgi:hypothetical protein
MLEVKIESSSTSWNNNLIIIHNGKEIMSYGDSGEPEDNSFLRDYGWVGPEIENSYALGYNDALNDLEKACVFMENKEAKSCQQ